MNSLNAGCESKSVFAVIRNAGLSAFSNLHSMTGQFQHSLNVKCSKIVQSSPAFEFELRHIPTWDTVTAVNVIVPGTG